MKSLRQILGLILSVSLCINPHLMSNAQAASQSAPQFQSLEEWVKAQEGLTLLQFYNQNKAFLPPAWKNDIEILVAADPQQKMPKLQVQKFKNARGEEQVRLQIKSKTTSYTVEDVAADDEGIVKFNDQILTQLDYDNPAGGIKKFNKVFARTFGHTTSKPRKRPYGIINAEDFLAMTKEGRATYFYNLRRVYESLIKLQVARENAKVASHALPPLPGLLLIPEYAHASVKEGQTCIFAGWFTKYAKTSGGAVCSAVLTKKLPQYPPMENCGKGNIACNPLVYGYDRGSGDSSPLCVTADNHATKSCGEKSPIESPLEKIALIKSVEKNLKIEMDEEGRISDADYKNLEGFLNQLRDHIRTSETHCQGLQSRDDQKEACDELQKRLLDFEKIACEQLAHYTPSSLCPAPPVAPKAEPIFCADPNDPYSCVCQVPPGALFDVVDKKCVAQCTPPMTQDGPQCRCRGPALIKDGKCVELTLPEPEPPKEEKPKAPKAKKDRGSWLPWVIGGVAVVALGYFAGKKLGWWAKKKKSGGSAPAIITPPDNPIRIPAPYPVPTIIPIPVPSTNEGGTKEQDHGASGVRKRLTQ